MSKIFRDIKDVFMTKIENNGSKKNIENLVFFVVILIVTIIFINYIWKDNKKENNSKVNSAISVSQNINSGEEVSNTESALENQLESILKKLEGVDDVSVLITYEETSTVIPMYNEDIQESITQEEDVQGGTRTINENSSKKEVVYEESNGQKSVVTSSVITPKIKGAIVLAKRGK